LIYTSEVSQESNMNSSYLFTAIRLSRNKNMCIEFIGVKNNS
jgi:hypothetical protein